MHLDDLGTWQQIFWPLESTIPSMPLSNPEGYYLWLSRLGRVRSFIELQGLRRDLTASKSVSASPSVAQFQCDLCVSVDEMFRVEFP